MKRPLLALCLSLVTGLAFAGEAASGNGYNAPPLCPKAAAKSAVAAPVVGAAVAQPPAAAARTRGGGGSSTTRLASPRWHSLLPGMFR